MKTYVYTKIHTQINLATLLTIVPNWKEPGYPSVGGWLNKPPYINTRKYYLAIKRNKL